MKIGIPFVVCLLNKISHQRDEMQTKLKCLNEPSAKGQLQLDALTKLMRITCESALVRPAFLGDAAAVSSSEKTKLYRVASSLNLQLLPQALAFIRLIQTC